MDDDELTLILRDAGYTVIAEPELRKLLKTRRAKHDGPPLCSGYRVFPDGKRCPGCPDCRPD